ncbi:MAG: glycine-rich protein [Pyrinomonadaceae bacterium]
MKNTLNAGLTKRNELLLFGTLLTATMFATISRLASNRKTILALSIGLCLAVFAALGSRTGAQTQERTVQNVRAKAALSGTLKAATISQTFNCTAVVQTFVVPAGVTTIDIEAFGAQGNFNVTGILGGLGGRSTGSLAVTPGSTLFINVGCGGVISTVGGFNGGGNSGANPGCSATLAGGGGGASDVRVGANNLAARSIVAAGGGGAGGNRLAGCGRGTGGGGGGGYYGGGGGAGWPGAPPGGPVPTGGAQVAGGAGGVTTFSPPGPTNGTDGALGIGGTGGNEVFSAQGASSAAEPGGAGGGLTGASGNHNSVDANSSWAGQSGAGGSSYIGGVSAATTSSGFRTGNGMIVLTYLSPPTASNVSVSGRVLMSAEGRGLRNAMVTITDESGKVRSALTGSLGYYHLEDIEAGHTYVISVRSRRFTFEPRVISVTDNLTDMDFFATR